MWSLSIFCCFLLFYFQEDGEVKNCMACSKYTYIHTYTCIYAYTYTNQASFNIFIWKKTFNIFYCKSFQSSDILTQQVTEQGLQNLFSTSQQRLRDSHIWKLFSITEAVFLSRKAECLITCGVSSWARLISKTERVVSKTPKLREKISFLDQTSRT